MTLPSICWLEAWTSFVLKREYSPLYSKLFSQIDRIILYSSFLASYMKGASNSSQAKASSASLVHSASSSLLQHAMHTQHIPVTRASRLAPPPTCNAPPAHPKTSNSPPSEENVKFWDFFCVMPSIGNLTWCAQKVQLGDLGILAAAAKNGVMHSLPPAPHFFTPLAFVWMKLGGILDLRF